jgi:hypothetical protein
MQETPKRKCFAPIETEASVASESQRHMTTRTSVHAESIHLYPHLLSDVFHHLPPVLRQFHTRLPNVGRGHARIVRASRGLAGIGALAMRLPATARRVRLEVTAHRGGERWLRAAKAGSRRSSCVRGAISR